MEAERRNTVSRWTPWSFPDLKRTRPDTVQFAGRAGVQGNPRTTPSRRKRANSFPRARHLLDAAAPKHPRPAMQQHKKSWKARLEKRAA
ncbi:hypothetical protein ACPA9J_18375 [Pseudomonas aeruginosa]